MIALVALAALAAGPPALLPGDPAPPLGVSEWFVGEPVTPGTTGRATLVEFTATWCGPCQAAMPEIVRLAHERAAELDVVSVHVWDEATNVAGHVERHPADELPPHIALAPRGPDSAQVTWMEAAGCDGVPTVFLVDATGTIAWIGYVGELPRVLDPVLTGQWDVAAARAEYVDLRRREAQVATWQPKVYGPDGDLLPGRDLVALLDNASQIDPDVRFGLADLWFPALAATDKRAAAAYAEELAANTDAVGAHTLNAVAWELVRDGAKVKASPAVIRTLSYASNERLGWADAYALDTWAHVLWREGDREGAIATEEKVLALDPDDATAKWATDELARFETSKPKR